MGASKRNRNNRNRGKNFERKVTKYLDFYRVPYSGSAENFGLGDVRDHEDQEQSLTLGECKSMTPASKTSVNYIIKEDWLLGNTGIIDQAKKSLKMPWLAFTKVRSAMWYVIILPSHFRMFLRSIELLEHNNIIKKTKNIDLLEDQINEEWEAMQDDE